MVNRASATNRNNIIIHNVVNAETKKRKQHRRQYPSLQQPQLVQQAVPMQQLPPQIFQQSGADPDLVKAVRDSVSSQAAMLNEFRDQRDREQELLASGIDAVTQSIGDKEERPFNRGYGAGSFGATGDVEAQASDVFADEPATFGAIPVAEGVRFGPDPRRSEAAKRAAATRERNRQANLERARQEGFMAREELKRQKDKERGENWYIE